MGSKMWGRNEFWGIGSEFDPDWVLDQDQKELRTKLIELCRTKIRPFAVKNDQTYEYPLKSLEALAELGLLGLIVPEKIIVPKELIVPNELLGANCAQVKSDQTYEYPLKSLEALAELGLLGLIVPKEFGGLGQNHVCVVAVVETIARYGCPSTAMIYAMHIQACAILLFRHHENDEIKNLLRRLNSDVLIGSSSYSDPATGGHFWFPLSSKAKKIAEDHFKVFRFNSWTTSAGFADFYVFQTPTPEIDRDHSNLTGFFVYKDEVRASSDNWASLGLHGNQSGPLVVEATLHMSRMIGKQGEGATNNSEAGAAFFLLCTSAVWNGISLGCVDLAKKHSTEKTHGDLGNRVCDYPVIQDYVGRCISETNSCRSLLLMMASQMDKETNDCDWALHEDPTFTPRSTYGLWLMQAKHNAAENVSRVGDLMLKACGGDGFKADLGLERLFRDGKAGCLMAPTNEVIRNLVGKGSLLGLSSLDMWNQTPNLNSVQNEINKMSLEEKKELLVSLGQDVKTTENAKALKHCFQDTDFDNPFNTGPPKHVKAYTTPDGVTHKPGLDPEDWKSLVLSSRNEINDKTTNFAFDLPSKSDHSGCLPGQYVQVRIRDGGKFHHRYFSPVSPPDQFGSLELTVRFETHGIVSQHFKNMDTGSSMEFRGPCGGFEFESNGLDELTMIASGSGVTPGIQILRGLSKGKDPRVDVTLIYYAKSVDDMLYKEELENMSKEMDRFRLVLSVAEAPEDWPWDEGPVDLKMIDRYVPKLNGKKHKILMCCGPGMSISVLHSLRLLKFPSDSAFVYGQFGTELIRAVFGRNVALSGHDCRNVV